jgi:hypothetical protein
MSDPQADTPPVEPREALLEAVETLTGLEDLPQLFHELAARLKTVVPFDFISVLLYDSADNVMRLHILEADRALNTVLEPDHPPSDSPGGWVWYALDFPAGKGLIQEEEVFPRKEVPAALALAAGRQVVLGRTELEQLEVTGSRTGWTASGIPVSLMPRTNVPLSPRFWLRISALKGIKDCDFGTRHAVVKVFFLVKPLPEL